MLSTPDSRAAAAGVVAARHLSPSNFDRSATARLCQRQTKERPRRAELRRSGALELVSLSDDTNQQ